MESPLDIVEDETGRLRDIHDRPMIVVFSTKSRPPRKHVSIKDKPMGVRASHFEFINVANPGVESEGTRQLIRTHVMQDVRNKQRMKARTAATQTNQGQSIFGIHDPQSTQIPPLPAANGIPFLDFPVPLRPYMRKLLHQYTTLITHITNPKLPTNPAESAWFPMVMTDAALFHAVLCASTIWVRILTGDSDEFSQSKHMFEAVSLVNGRLSNGDISDATIATVLFLAKAEYTQRNYATWGVHMNGVKKMVEMRGEMMMIPVLVRSKILEAELLGCIETGSVPRFPSIGDASHISSDTAPHLPYGFVEFVQRGILRGELLSLFGDIEEVTRVAQIDETSLRMDEPSMALIRYRLLFQANEGMTNDDLNIRTYLRDGAIIYIQTLLPKMPVRAVDLSIPLSRLQVSMLALKIPNVRLLIWVSAIAAIVAEGDGKEYFMEKLRNYMMLAGIEAWHGLREILFQYWWIDAMHDDLGRRLWGEVCRDAD
ncbi:hypothetical protein BKA64DRAFT_753898 [Cadophora sp. MPI-SDFR-AT-0126]|nr:hypothetical protein BKA64DRAFT_753898 [Leotiomycetes sp. MPI-SDFR-AT-0126]